MELIYIGKSGEYAALIDDEDFELVSQYNWTIKLDTKARTIYALRRIRQSPEKYSGYDLQYMHTLITGFAECDHIDADGLNNQKSNLRDVSHAQNIQRQQTQTRSVSGYRGVSYFPNCGKWERKKPWRARVKIDGNDRTIGYFRTPEEAAVAWNKVAYAAWGEFARLNKITEERK